VPGRILLVEDDRSLCEEIRDILEFEGFSVSLAHDGDTGLDMAMAGGFDVMILDLKLPGLSGLDILRAVRSEHLPLKVLVLTASMPTFDLPDGTQKSEADDTDALNEADVVMGKPFNVSKFIDLTCRLAGLR
jgi:DNA-binding response OmpR family regulator